MILTMRNSAIEIVGTVVCPDGEHAVRREISICKSDTDKLPQVSYPIRRKNGTKVKLIINAHKYETILHRYESSSCIADAYRIMGFHLKDALRSCGFDQCGTKLRLEFKGFNIRISRFRGKGAGG